MLSLRRRNVRSSFGLVLAAVAAFAPEVFADIISSEQSACSRLHEAEGCILPSGGPGRCQYPPGYNASSRDVRGRPILLECRAFDPASEAVRSADATANIESPPSGPARPAPASARVTTTSPPARSGGCTVRSNGPSTGDAFACVALVAVVIGARARRRREAAR